LLSLPQSSPQDPPNPQNQNPQKPAGLPIQPNTNPEKPEEEKSSYSVEIKQSDKEGGALRDLFTRAAARMESGEEEEEEKQPKGGRSKKLGDPRKDLANLLTSGLTLLVASLSIPDELKPNEDEIGGVSFYTMKILLRHFPVSKMLSADMLDVVGLVSIFAGYFARIQPLLPKKPPPGPGNNPGPNRPPEKSNGHKPAEKIPENDIEVLDPATAEFLKNAANGRTT
jgi:hypothetical protein